MKLSLSKGISKNVFALGSTSLLTDVSREMIYPLLPLYLRSVLGASTTFVGLVEGIAESTSSVLKLLSGWLSDKLRKRKTLLLWGYSLSAVTRPLIAVATVGWHILVVRFVEKVGKGIRVPPRDALIAESCTPENRGRGFGLHRSMDNVGSIVGPLLASSLLVYLSDDYRALFWISSIPAFLAIGILTFVVSEEPREISKIEVSSENRRFDLKQFNKKFKIFLIATIIFEMANSSNAFLLLRVQDIGLSLELIPIIYLFSNIFKTMSSMPGGILSDKLGRRNVLIAGWIIYGISYFGFAFITSVTEAWIIFGIYGLFSGMTEGVKKAFVVDLVPKEVRGSALGIHSFLVSFPQLPASLLLGFLWQKFNATIAFSVGASFAVVAAILLLISIPSEKETAERLQAK
ncbi:MAG: MFS transporter [Thermodesulfobacteriota bacterium]